MKKSLIDISPVVTSHKAGLKRVLLSAEESGCAITQIAITDLKAGEVVTTHIHQDMQEGFYVISGKFDMTLDGIIEYCHEGDFIWVSSETNHELRALTDVRIMTIGCAIDFMV